MKQPELKVPFKFNFVVFKIDTIIIKPLSFTQIIILVILCLGFTLLLILFLKAYSIGFTIQEIFERTAKSKFWKIFKPRSP